jgi:hypothetical protein
MGVNPKLATHAVISTGRSLRFAHTTPAIAPALAVWGIGREQRANAEMTMDRANAVLCRGGVAKKAIEAHYCYLVDASRATEEILRFARLRKCHTVVIGREPLSWLMSPKWFQSSAIGAARREGFIFSVKVPRIITNEKALVHCDSGVKIAVRMSRKVAVRVAFRIFRRL